VDGAGEQSDTKVTVDVLDADQAKKYGAQGVTLRLHRTDDGGSAPVAVRVPDSVLTGLFGADYAGRVRWVQYPDTGHGPGNGQQSAPTTTSGENTVVSPQLAGASTMMLAATSSTTSSSGTGDFGATSLSPSGEWDVSAQSGDFSWSYPLRVPPAAAGPAPSLALDYDSQQVDGETGSTNNQPSAVGDGWSLAGGGFVERSYVPCSVDNGPSGPVTTSGDQCWKTDNATLSLGGHSGRLVRDAATGAWKLQSDDGSRFEHLTGAGNGAQGGEYWRLTTTDGTQYYFGLNQLPGWSSGKPTTNSAWTLPVYGNDAGEPCHASTFAGSACTQAWRWNLDYVVDPHGNASSYYYTPETNRYAQNGSGATTYVRGGQLEHIEYGLTASTVYAANGASDKVLFGYAGRCVSSTGCDSAHPTNWPDVPWDQNCAAAPCTQVSPSFWTTQRLSTVSTQFWTGSSYATVDTWTLNHTYPDPGDGTSAALWLASVSYKGTSGGDAITLPDISFTGATLQNRVWAVDGLAPLDKYRITSITTETGAVISVNYSAQDCTPAEAATIEANANTNTRRCFPQWWTPQTTPPQPAKLDLFHKYVVTSVLTDPRTGGTNDAVQETDYVYTGTPAWRYDTSPLTPENRRTWSGYAGYSSVEVRVGDHNNPAGQQTTAYTFFQGMDGDRAATSGGTKSVSVRATDGSRVPDSLWLAGRVREARVLNGVGGAVVSDIISTAWASGATANDGTATARFVGDGSVVTTAPLSTGGTRRTETRTSYDAYGRTVQVEAITPDAGTTCTRTSYATNTSTWLMAFPSETSVVGKPCSVTPSYPADAISDTRTVYDGGTFGGAPAKGDVTSAQVVKAYTGSTAASAVWLTTSTMSYDARGRVTSATDLRAGLNRTTTTAFTPATGGPVTKTVVTNSLGWTSTTSVNPAWGVETAVTDQNGHTTSATYDALGRRTAVWTPGRPQASNPTPSVAFAYTVSATAPLAVSTTRLTPIGTVTGWTLYDGLGRLRQTQDSAPGGGTAVADTYYDAAGRDYQHNQPYYTTSVQPSGTLFVPSTTISGQDLSTFDGAGRAVTVQQWVNGAKAWQTSNAYLGADRVDTTPPSGGTPTSTFTDSLGHTTKLVEYLAAAPSGTAQQEATTYRYDAAGRRTGMTDAAGNVWGWAFDALGRQVSASDPDSGTTTTAYDDAGRAVSTTDARGTTLVSTYDALDRRTSLNQGTATGPLLAGWTYDTLSKGRLTRSSSYVGSTSGTPGAAYTQAVTGYDGADRPTGHSTTLPAGTPLAGTYTSSVSYMQDGSVQQVSEPAEGGIAAETLKYSYDGLGNIAGLTGTISGSTFTYAGGIAYTYLGGVAQYAQSRASQYFYRTFTYADGTNRLTELSGIASSTANTVTSDRKFSYDNAGNVTAVSTTAAGISADNQCFGYDALRDLTQAWTPTSGNCSAAPTASALGGPAPYWTSYGVDPATRNRTSVVSHSTTGGADTTETYAYPAAGQPRPHAVQAVTRTTGSATTTNNYAWDANGNTVARPGQTLSYDARNKLGSLTVTGTGKEQTNVYDAEGTLLVQSDPVNGTTVFLGNTQLRVAAGAATASASRTYAFNGVSVAERNTTAGVAGSTLYFLDADPLGTATVEVRATDGKVTRRYQDPFGVARGIAVAWSSARGYLNAPTSSFSGLTQLGARAYDPSLGRFLSVDPLLEVFDPGSLGAYAYANNSPVTNSDPSGLCATERDDGKCWKPKGTTPRAATASNHPPAAPGRGSSVDSTGADDGGGRRGTYKVNVIHHGSRETADSEMVLLSLHGESMLRHRTGQGWCHDAVVACYISGTVLAISCIFTPGCGHTAAHASLDPGVRSAANKLLNGDPDERAAAQSVINRASGKAVEAEIAQELSYLCQPRECRTNQYRRAVNSGWRAIDVLTTGGTAVEVKSGRVGIDGDIRRQIARDVALMDTEQNDVDSVVWVFTASPITGRMGPTRSVENALKDAGVSYIILTE
jgi:RHS repeat-associated protein